MNKKKLNAIKNGIHQEYLNHLQMQMVCGVCVWSLAFQIVT